MASPPVEECPGLADHKRRAKHRAGSSFPDGFSRRIAGVAAEAQCDPKGSIDETLPTVDDLVDVAGIVINVADERGERISGALQPQMLTDQFADHGGP